MTMHHQNLVGQMPAPSPLEMPTQGLSRTFHDPQSHRFLQLHNTTLYRVCTFVPAVTTTLILIAVIFDWFQKDGFAPAEIVMLGLVGFSAFWIALSVAASTIGLFFERKYIRAPQPGFGDALDVALLVPIYNEDVGAVHSRVRAMQSDLCRASSMHGFAIFILSDTRDAIIAADEAAHFTGPGMESSKEVPVFYRRRAMNTERKTGNIRDWITKWGNGWDAFITLDADSLMSARTMARLVDELVACPEAGLLQTVPRLMGANTIFGRVQQFANNIYGGVLARGLDRWSGHEGNYWGHNAIIRTRAFAACAGLPKLRGSGALGGTIKSHDFVEAALLRRAGWSVRLMPHLDESYEEVPQTIVDYVLRDRRWCQGNLQHLRLIFSKGFSPASRFHMFQGAMAYIASVLWFVLLVLWALMGQSEENNVFRYFTDTNPLFPQWPEMDVVSRAVVLGFMFGLLLLPKFFGIVQTLISDPGATKLGGLPRFFLSSMCEIFLSFTLAPIMMVQHVTAVMRTVFGLDAGWVPQNRTGGQYSWLMLGRFHWLETSVGLILLVGTMVGIVTLWLVPIAISLSCAVPISRYFGKPLPGTGILSHLMETRESRAPTPIINTARTYGKFSSYPPV